MNKKIFVISFIILSLIGYSSFAQKPDGDSIQIRRTIVNFYDWYHKNDSKLNAFKLYYSIKKKDNPPYRINWKEVDRYVAYVRASVPYLGEAFIKNQRAFLKQCDSMFKVYPEDDIPYGFDYDWYTDSQEESQYTLDEVKNMTRLSIVYPSKDRADVIVYTKSEGVDEKFLSLRMSREKGKWKFARIGNNEDQGPPPAIELKQQ